LSPLLTKKGKKKKPAHIFAPPHNSLVVSSLSLDLFERAKQKGLNGRKKGGKGIIKNITDSLLKVKETLSRFPLVQSNNQPHSTLAVCALAFPCALIPHFILIWVLSPLRTV
jgi:hypothetical protein